MNGTQTTGYGKRSISYYPTKSKYKDECDFVKNTNMKTWEEIQETLGRIATDTLMNISEVKEYLPAIKIGRNCRNFENKLEQMLLSLLHNSNDDIFIKWLNASDEFLNKKYNYQLFAYINNERNFYQHLMLSQFMNKESLKNMFNAYILMFILDIIEMNETTLEIMRERINKNQLFQTTMREKFKVMDNFHIFSDVWKGGEYYIKQLF